MGDGSLEVNPDPPADLAGRSSKLRPNFVRLSVKGALGQWELLASRLGGHLWLECLIPLLINLPLSFTLSFLIFFKYINDWNRETWTFVTAAVAFLLTQKLSLAYARFWEARGHLGEAVKCCRSILVMVKPRLDPSHRIAAEAADDIRRYCMLYYWTMCFQLLGMETRQAVVMHHLKDRPEEEEHLFKREENQALTALMWLSSRIADLAVEGVLTQHELQEGLRRVDEMVEAFNGTTKIKNTPIPVPMEHLCAVLTNLYVWTSPLALATAFKNGLGNPISCEDAWTRYCSDELGNCAQNATYLHTFGDDDLAQFSCTSEACPELVFLGTLYPGDKCPTVGFTSVGGRTMAGSFFLAAAFYGIFELGNAFAEPFGDDESDLGWCMMSMGNGLEADLRFMMETCIPHSRLRRALDSQRYEDEGQGHPPDPTRTRTRRASAVTRVRSAACAGGAEPAASSGLELRRVQAGSSGVVDARGDMDC